MEERRTEGTGWEGNMRKKSRRRQWEGKAGMLEEKRWFRQECRVFVEKREKVCVYVSERERLRKKIKGE